MVYVKDLSFSPSIAVKEDVSQLHGLQSDF